MNDEIKRIQNLLDKYMDGATSNEEEATLRKYFEEHGNDIPEEWESYRALFSYIGFEQIDLGCGTGTMTELLAADGSNISAHLWQQPLSSHS